MSGNETFDFIACRNEIKHRLNTSQVCCETISIVDAVSLHLIYGQMKRNKNYEIKLLFGIVIRNTKI